MSWVDTTIAEFGRSIGLPGLAPDTSGAVRFSVENGLRLSIDRGDEYDDSDVLVSVTHPGLDMAGARALLRACDFRRAGAWQLQAVRRDDDTVLTMRIPRRYFTRDVLEEGITVLFALQGSATRATA